MRYSNWYERWRRARLARWYSDKIVGAAKPASHFTRPTRRQMMASARRFFKSGELHNAVEMLKLAFHPQQLKFHFIYGEQKIHDKEVH